jgi:hypothetical protein
MGEISGDPESPLRRAPLVERTLLLRATARREGRRRVLGAVADVVGARGGRRQGCLDRTPGRRGRRPGARGVTTARPQGGRAPPGNRLATPRARPPDLARTRAPARVRTPAEVRARAPVRARASARPAAPVGRPSPAPGPTTTPRSARPLARAARSPHGRPAARPAPDIRARRPEGPRACRGPAVPDGRRTTPGCQDRATDASAATPRRRPDPAGARSNAPAPLRPGRPPAHARPLPRSGPPGPAPGPPVRPDRSAPVPAPGLRRAARSAAPARRTPAAPERVPQEARHRRIRCWTRR